MTLLAVEDLRVAFPADEGEVRALDGATFAVAEGETLGIVGESGSGKSAAALTILGLTRLEGARVSGSVALSGRELTTLDEAALREVRGREVGIVFQDPLSSLHPLLRVGDQIAEAITAHRAAAEQTATDRAVELLELVGIPDAARRARGYPHELSGGMRQRAMIAMALANDPKLLIADEPTTALDVTTQAEILALLGRLRDELGMAMVLITHDLGVIAGTADRVAVMQSGRVVEEGDRAGVFARPRHPHTRELLEAVPARRATSEAGRRAASESEPLLEVRDLVKHYRVRSGILLGRERGRVRAVDDVSLSLAAGETLALVGESGSGKSTLCRAALRLIDFDSGSVLFRGEDLSGVRGSRLRELRADMQIVFQDPLASLNPRRTAGAIVAEPLRVHRRETGSRLSRRVDELLETVGLAPAYRSRYPHQLSGGERQRIGIARALALEPRLLFADEPVSALDASVRIQILDLLARLRDQLGLGMLLVSHDLGLVGRVADRIAVMKDGRIVEIGAAERVLEQPDHAYTRELLAAIPEVPAAGAG